MTIKEELEALKAEKEALELQLLREQVRAAKEKAASKQAAHENVERDLAEFHLMQQRRQEQCNHRKGGRDLEGIQGRGTSSQYAVIKHQLPLGDWVVICQRCQKIWKKGDPEYTTALQYPTDNSPSGSTLFIVQPTNA